MVKPLIIFGTGKIADVVYACFQQSSDYEVVGFTCDSKFISERTFHNLPVEDFESIENTWPASEYEVFVALGYQEINTLRESKVEQIKSKGYKLASFIAEDLAYLDSISFGEHCFVMSGADIQPQAQIGSNVFVWSGAIVGHHSQVNDNVWVTSAAKIAGNVKVGANTFLAMGATIGNEVTIGKKCFLGANSLTTKNLEDESVVIEGSTEVFRLKTSDFLRISRFQ